LQQQSALWSHFEPALAQQRFGVVDEVRHSF
jgi:hypothetical protein